MEYECPICGYLNKDLDDSLPKLACDTTEHECGGCEGIVLIGWIAEVEVRGVKK
jgi:hypothetical protein